MQMRKSVVLSVVLCSLASVSDAFGCFRGPLHPVTLVADADVIVRAKVEGQSERDTVALTVLEHLKGEHQFIVTVRGTVRGQTDLNWRPVPVGLTRLEGKGSCEHGLTYQRGGEYLLLLKKVDGVLTPYWALGVTNEQLRGPDDEWLLWVKEQVARNVKIGARPMFPVRHEKQQLFTLGK